MSELQLVYERFYPVWDGSQYMQPFFWVVTWSLMFSFAVAFAMGANDVANSFGTSVGARVLSIPQVVILAGLCSFVGAVGLGGRTAETIRNGIIDIESFEDVPHLYICAMCSALFGTFTLVFVATILKMPVSTTHAIVGAVMGPGIVQFGKSGVDWLGFGKIVIGWFVAPVLAGLIAAGFYTLQKKVVLIESDLEKSLKNQLWFTSGQMGVIVFIVLFFIFLEVNDNLPNWMQIAEIPNPPTWPGSLVMPLICVGSGAIVTVISRYFLMPKMFRAIERDARSGGAYYSHTSVLNSVTNDIAKQDADGEAKIVIDQSSLNGGLSTSTELENQKGENEGRENQSERKQTLQRKKTDTEDGTETEQRRLAIIDENKAAEEVFTEDLENQDPNGKDNELIPPSMRSIRKKKSWVEDLLTLTHDYDDEDHKCEKCEKKKLERRRLGLEEDLEVGSNSSSQLDDTEQDDGTQRKSDDTPTSTELAIEDAGAKQKEFIEDVKNDTEGKPVKTSSSSWFTCWKSLKHFFWETFEKDKKESELLRNHFKTWWHDLFTLNHEAGTYALENVRDEKAERFRNCADKYPEEIEIRFKAVQVVSASFMAFSAGANDIANAAGPVAGTIQTFQTATINGQAEVSTWVLVYTGVATIIGLAVLGAGVMATVGHNTTKITPSRGVNIEIGAALAVTIGSILAIPTSATQCVIGAVVAVGLCNKNHRNAVNWSLLGKIFCTWVLTPFTSGAVSAGIYALLRFAAESQVPPDFFPISNTSTAYGQHYPFGVNGNN